MQIERVSDSSGNGCSYALLNDAGQPIASVSGFLRHLAARNYSPNTLAAYSYDLLHFFNFLEIEKLDFSEFNPARSLAFLDYLRTCSSRRKIQRLGLALCVVNKGSNATRLSATTINRIFAAVSSFYEYLIISDQLGNRENPIIKVFDPALAQVSERHRPFMGSASHQHPIRRVVRVKVIQHLPRPIGDEELELLLKSFSRLRDKAMFLLMSQGGLRPGEVLNLHLEDIQYGRRRIVIRYRSDHPKGVRTKSRTERMVDLYQAETLSTLSAYVMQERSAEAATTLVFLVGGKGTRCCEPLGYQALVRLFARHCEQLGIRQPWVTPHALRHTHATKMWEGGMRELSLQKRLGHASPESTRVYTRVSDPQVVEEYKRALGGIGETK